MLVKGSLYEAKLLFCFFSTKGLTLWVIFFIMFVK